MTQDVINTGTSPYLQGKLGSRVITAGDGGQFRNIDAALAYLETVTGMTQVSGSTGTVTATNSSDVVTGSGTNFLSIIKAGDLITTSGDGIVPVLTSGIYFPI